jgi:hypothetical protein
LFIAAQYDVPPSATVSTVGASFGGEFVSMKVYGAVSSFSASAADFYIVNKVRFHNYSIFFVQSMLQFFNYCTNIFKYGVDILVGIEGMKGIGKLFLVVFFYGEGLFIVLY